MEKTMKLILLSVVSLSLISTAEGHGGFKDLLGFFRINVSDNGKEYFWGQKAMENDLKKNITDVMNDKIPTEAYVLIFTALGAPEAQKSLKQLNVNPTSVNDLLRKLTSGNAQLISEAKQTIKTQAANIRLDQYKKKEWKAIKQLMGVYQTLLYRQSAKQSISQDPVDKLIKGLTAVAVVEKIFWFRDIHFKDLVENLKKNGEQGRKEVIDKLSKWIDSADIESVKRAALIYGLATPTNSAQISTTPLSSTTTPYCITLTPNPSLKPVTSSSTVVAASTPSGGLSSTVASSTPAGGQSTVPQSTTPRRAPE